jgi:hypothetical protein
VSRADGGEGGGGDGRRLSGSRASAYLYRIGARAFRRFDEAFRIRISPSRNMYEIDERGWSSQKRARRVQEDRTVSRNAATFVVVVSDEGARGHTGRRAQRIEPKGKPTLPIHVLRYASRSSLVHPRSRTRSEAVPSRVLSSLASSKPLRVLRGKPRDPTPPRPTREP